MFAMERFSLPRRAHRSLALAGAMPPTGFVLLSIGATQLGAAIAKSLFAALGPGGTVFLRVGFAALVLGLWWRPRLRGHRRGAYALVALFGLVLGGMNLAFYSALERIPLGIAVTLEFVGPLGVAVAGSRRRLDLVWVLLAAAGIVLLAPLGAGATALDPRGVALALLAGGLWAAYILLGARVGQALPGGAGLALAMGVAAVALVPLGVARGGAALLDFPLLAAGLGVALLSSALPYSLELEALRRLPARVFGVLMSLEPAIAAVVGLALLRETLPPRALGAIVLVTIAAVGTVRFATGEERG
jgi:inner membrane transporter RhtA